MKTYWFLKYDIPAGVAVFLVALPLSLGIALASGAPLFSGLIAGIVGGVIIAPLSGSQLGISGTAAGLTVMVAAAIENLGFNQFLLTVVLTGIFQIMLGIFKAGTIAYYFPSSVVKGMLSGIGFIIVLKQIPHALGYDNDFEGELSFSQADHYTSFSELGHALNSISLTSTIIALISLAILIIWETPQFKKHYFFQFFHGSLMAILVGTGLNHFLTLSHPKWALKSEHLVEIPVMNNLDDFAQQLHFPDFTQLNNPQIYLTALALGLIASVETLLAIDAIDKLDKKRRTTPPNRELIAQGVGNIVSGFIGGLPITQVIVRSSLNAQSGAQTKMAAFIQGALLFLTVVFIPNLLNQIPLASLASILIVVGYKLIRPKVFQRMYKTGMYHFLPFIITILGLIFTDMMTGITIGLIVSSLSIVLENRKGAFYLYQSRIGHKTILRLAEHVSFLNKADLRKTLQTIPKNSSLVIDATRSKYLDYDVFEIIERFAKEASLKNITLTLENMRGFGILEPVQYARPHTKASQQALTPTQVLDILKEGNENFINNLKENRNLLEQVNDTRQGQFPIAIILSCMDSRTSVELIFDQGLGDVFSTRVAGNVVNDDILGSMEYACKVAGSKLIVVLGHTHCGAIKGACSHVELGNLTGLLHKIQPAIDLVKTHNPHILEKELEEEVAQKNVLLTVEHIKKRSPLLNDMLKDGDIRIVGGMYDIETGKVHFYE